MRRFFACFLNNGVIDAECSLIFEAEEVIYFLNRRGQLFCSPVFFFWETAGKPQVIKVGVH